jgi:NTE family protein
MINHKLIVMKKLLSVITLACVFTFSGLAQILPSAHPAADSLAFAKVRARMDSIRQYRPTVGLVLAGGGARGLAHLGVIKYMEELGIPVDVITGTSMGGLVGGLYALGYKHDQLDSLVRDIEWPVMMSDNIPDGYIGYKLRKYRDTYVLRIPHHYDDEDLADRLKNERIAEKMAEEAGYDSADMLSESISKIGLGMPDGFLYGLNVRNMLSSVSVGYQDSLSFADLPIPYACVATDLYAMTPKYWTSGSITDAMRSTMAIPFYFRAVRQNGEVLLDGGMRNNYPADLAREMGADIIIGSDMSIHRELNELNSPVDFLLQTITLLASSANGPAREMLDLGVHHELKGYTMLSFDDKSVDDIIDQGYQNALEHKDLFESIAAAVAGKPLPDVTRHPSAVNLALRKVRVADVRFTGIREDEQKHLLHSSDYPDDGMYDRAVIEDLLNDIYGTNAFESITYHLEGNEEPYTLVFDCQKGQTNDAAIGIRADTDETVAVALHYGLGTRRLGGSRLTADLKLGTNPALSVDWSHKSQIGFPTFGLTARARLMNCSNGYMSTVSDKLFSTAVDAYMEDSRMRFGNMRIGLTAEMDPYDHYLTTNQFWTGWDWKSYWLSAFATFKFDTFNDGYFPTRGVRMALDGRYVFKGYTIDLDPNDPSNSYIDSMDPQALTEDGTVPRYGSVLASFEGAFSFGSNFTVLPKLYFGWYPVRDSDTSESNCLNPKHIITIGGFMPNRYTERQIPFFGFPNGFRNCRPFSAVGQLDLRYRFARKNYLTARAGVFTDSYSLKDFIYVYPVMAFGLEYARQTIVGPLKLAAQWCDITGFTAYAGIGFDF